MGSDLSNLIDRLKPIAYVYCFKDQEPPRVDEFLDVSVELKTEGNCEFLTFWFRWDHDWEGDGKVDWEPVTYVLGDDIIVDIQTRPHWTLARWLTDEPILENGERAVVYFSKNGHAPYLSVPSTTEIGWLRSTLIKMRMGRETGFAFPDFLEVMSERDLYVRARFSNVRENYGPPHGSKAREGVKLSFLEIRLFDKWYTKPDGC